MSCEKSWITAFRVKVTAKGQNVNVFKDDIFLTTKHFVSKLSIVMHHYGRKSETGFTASILKKDPKHTRD